MTFGQVMATSFSLIEAGALWIPYLVLSRNWVVRIVVLPDRKTAEIIRYTNNAWTTEVETMPVSELSFHKHWFSRYWFGMTMKKYPKKKFKLLQHAQVDEHMFRLLLKPPEDLKFTELKKSPEELWKEAKKAKVELPRKKTKS